MSEAVAYISLCFILLNILILLSVTIIPILCLYISHNKVLHITFFFLLYFASLPLFLYIDFTQFISTYLRFLSSLELILTSRCLLSWSLVASFSFSVLLHSLSLKSLLIAFPQIIRFSSSFELILTFRRLLSRAIRQFTQGGVSLFPFTPPSCFCHPHFLYQLAFLFHISTFPPFLRFPHIQFSTFPSFSTYPRFHSSISESDLTFRHWWRWWGVGCRLPFSGLLVVI